MIPTTKFAAAHLGGDDEWRRVRPPLVELGDNDRAKLVGELNGIGFEMPGLGD